MRFPGDVVAQFDASFAAPLRQRLEAVGEEGVLLAEAPWRVDWGGGVVLRRGGDEKRVEVEDGDSYRLELENMSAAIRGRARPLLGREDALGQARALAALYRSADDAAPVALDA
jgi:predicted dehydrogenase